MEAISGTTQESAAPTTAAKGRKSNAKKTETPVTEPNAGANTPDTSGEQTQSESNAGANTPNVSDEQKPPTPPEDVKPKESFIYIGPHLPGGALPSNRIFQGSREEIEEALADVLAKYPKVKSLIVPSAALAASKLKVKAANNILGQNYAALRAEFAKGVKENGV